VLMIVIDEQGRVEHASVVQSLDPTYEARLLDAVKGWRYTPALRDGQRVKYVKVLEITLSAIPR
jgi:TonB family protein